MYNRELETSAEAKKTHDSNQAKIAQERLKKNAEWKKKHKVRKED